VCFQWGSPPSLIRRRIMEHQRDSDVVVGDLRFVGLMTTTSLSAVNQYTFFFPPGAKPPSGSGPPHCRCFTITHRERTLGRIPLDEGPARLRDLYLTTYNTRDRHPSPGGIRTHNTSKQAATDPRLQPRGHWDRFFFTLVLGKLFGDFRRYLVKE
jgi:hypothetical protein